MLNSLLTGKATGLDNISAKLLKVASPVIAESLCVIFNKSVETGIFPTEWKKAEVFPVHKKDDKSDPNNYRPISVLPTIGTIVWFSFVAFYSNCFIRCNERMVFQYRSRQNQCGSCF